MKVINANRLPLFCLLLLCACQLLVSCSWEDYQHPDWTKDRAKIRAMKFVDKENELSEFSKILVSKWICSINRNSRGTLEAYSCFPIDHNFYEKRSVEIPKDFVSPKVLDDENGWSFWSLDTEPNGYSLEIPAWTGGVKKMCDIWVCYLQLHKDVTNKPFVWHENIWDYSSEFKIGNDWTIGFPCTRETCESPSSE